MHITSTLLKRLVVFCLTVQVCIPFSGLPHTARKPESYKTLLGDGVILIYDKRRPVLVTGHTINIPIALIKPDHDFMFCMTLEVKTSAPSVYQENGHTKSFEQESVYIVTGTIPNLSRKVACEIRGERYDINRLIDLLAAAQSHTIELKYRDVY